MSYSYNNPYQQQYRPYTPAPQVWQPSAQQNWQQAAPLQAWQAPAEQPPAEPMQQQEDPVVLILRDLVSELAAIRKALMPKQKKKEADDE